MANLNITPELKNELLKAKSIEQVKDLLAQSGQKDIDQEAEKLWKELEHHKVDYKRELSMDELESVSGGKHSNCRSSYEFFDFCDNVDCCFMFNLIYK